MWQNHGVMGGTASATVDFENFHSKRISHVGHGCNSANWIGKDSWGRTICKKVRDRKCAMCKLHSGWKDQT